MTEAPKIITETIEGISVVNFTEVKILDESAVKAVGNEFDQLASQDNVSRVLLDFHGVELLTSTIIGKIIGLHNKLAKKSGYVKICGLNAVIREVFTITSLDRVFEIHDDRESGLWSYK